MDVQKEIAHMKKLFMGEKAYGDQVPPFNSRIGRTQTKKETEFISHKRDNTAKRIRSHR